MALPGSSHSGFRNRSARALTEAHAGPNMTPMVDVVMVILIFFMASTAILGPEWFIKTALPTVRENPNATPNPDAPPPLRITLRTLDNNTRVFFNDEPDVAMNTLESRIKNDLSAKGPDLVVIVTPEDSVPWEDVVKTFETLYKLGVKFEKGGIK
jgi:biopolymer transport protein ExbD